MKQKQTPSQANSRSGAALVAAGFEALSLEPGEQRTNHHVYHEFAWENETIWEWVISRYPRPPPKNVGKSSGDEGDETRVGIVKDSSVTQE